MATSTTAEVSPPPSSIELLFPNKPLTYLECKRLLAVFSGQVGSLGMQTRGIQRFVRTILSEEKKSSAKINSNNSKGHYSAAVVEELISSSATVQQFERVIALRQELQPSEAQLQYTLLGRPHYSEKWINLQEEFHRVSRDFLSGDVAIYRLTPIFGMRTTATFPSVNQRPTGDTSLGAMGTEALEEFLRERELTVLQLLSRAEAGDDEDCRRLLPEASVQLEAARRGLSVSSDEPFFNIHSHTLSQTYPAYHVSPAVVRLSVRLRALEARLERLNRKYFSSYVEDLDTFVAEDEQRHPPSSECPPRSETSCLQQNESAPKKNNNEMKKNHHAKVLNSSSDSFIEGSGIDRKEMHELFNTIFDELKIKERKKKEAKEKKRKREKEKRICGQQRLENDRDEEADSDPTLCRFPKPVLQAFTDRSFYLPLKHSEDIFVSELLCEVLLFLPISSRSSCIASDARLLSNVCLVSKAWYERARCLPHWQLTWDRRVQAKSHHSPPNMCLGQIEALVDSNSDKKYEGIAPSPSVMRVSVGTSNDFLHDIVQTREQFIAHRQEGLKKAFFKFREGCEEPHKEETKSFYLSFLRLAVITMIPLALGILLGGQLPEETLLGGTAGLVIGCQVLGSIIFAIFLYCSRFGRKYLSPKFTRAWYQPVWHKSNLGTAFLGVQYFQRLLGVLVVIVAVAFSRASFLNEITSCDGTVLHWSEQSMLNFQSPYIVSWSTNDTSLTVTYNETTSMLTFNTTAKNNTTSSPASSSSFYLYKDDCASYSPNMISSLRSNFEIPTGIPLVNSSSSDDSDESAQISRGHGSSSPSVSVVGYRTAKGIPGGGFWGGVEVPNSNTLLSPANILLPCHRVPVEVTPKAFLLEEKTSATHLSWILLAVLSGSQFLCLVTYGFCVQSVRRGRKNCEERIFGARDSLSSADIAMMARLANNGNDDWYESASGTFTKNTIEEIQVPLQNLQPKVETASRLMMKENPHKYIRYDLPDGFKCFITLAGFVTYFCTMVSIAVIGGLCSLESSDEFRSISVGKMTCSLVSYQSGGVTMLVFGILAFVAGPLAVVFLGFDRIDDD